jgi:hypothetical protein
MSFKEFNILPDESNPYSIIRVNRDENTINDNNIIELIKISLYYTPEYMNDKVFAYMIKAFPQYKEIIQKYQILI